MDFLANKIAEEMIADVDNEEEAPYSEEEYKYTQEPRSSSMQPYICDTCERDFQTYWQHRKHMSEHRTCGLDGCTFTAHEKIIEKHVQMQHSSGLYEKIRNIMTPEDIKKWVDERKSKYPKKENVEKRYQQQEEMLKRGEKLQKTTSRFDKNNKSRYALNKQNRARQKFDKKQITKRKMVQQQLENQKVSSLIDEKSDWNGNLFPFKGTGQLYNEEQIENEDDIDDTEWSDQPKEKVAPINDTEWSDQPKEKAAPINALGALLCAYNSEDDSEMEETVVTTEPAKQIVEPEENKLTTPDPPINSDDEAPLEQKIARQDDLPEQALPASSDSKQTCSKRKRTHKKGPTNFKQRKLDSTNDSTNIYRKRRVTLLERLLASEITHERNVLLQCVRYVVTNEFFDVKRDEVQVETSCDNYEMENVN